MEGFQYIVGGRFATTGGKDGYIFIEEIFDFKFVIPFYTLHLVALDDLQGYITMARQFLWYMRLINHEASVLCLLKLQGITSGYF